MQDYQVARLGKDSCSQRQDTASWNFWVAISAFLLNAFGLRIEELAELECWEPDTLADTALFEQLPNTTTRKVPDWHSRHCTGKLQRSRAIWMSVPPQGRLRWQTHRLWVQTTKWAVCSNSAPWVCVSLYVWRYKCKGPATVVSTAHVLLTCLTDFSI